MLLVGTVGKHNDLKQSFLVICLQDELLILQSSAASKTFNVLKSKNINANKIHFEIFTIRVTCPILSSVPVFADLILTQSRLQYNG